MQAKAYVRLAAKARTRTNDQNVSAAPRAPRQMSVVQHDGSPLPADCPDVSTYEGSTVPGVAASSACVWWWLGAFEVNPITTLGKRDTNSRWAGFDRPGIGESPASGADSVETDTH